METVFVHRFVRVIVSAITAIVVVAAPTPATTSEAAAAPGAATIARLGGADRYATAASISSSSFGPGVPVVFVSTGRNFPDALTAAPAAARAGGPILLVDTHSIPAATAAELDRLDPGRIVIVGASGAVSDGVAGALDAYDTGGGVTRIGGATRYDTAVQISQAHFGAGAGTVYVATGRNFPDALAAAAVASRDGHPILIVEGDSVPSAVSNELARLAPGRIVIVGGPGVVSEGVANHLRTITGNVQRIGGGDRYATAAMIAAASFGPGVPAYIATGSNFPDALAGAVVAARSGAPILLVKRSDVTSASAGELARIQPPGVVLLGASGVVGDGALTGIRNALGQGGNFHFQPWTGSTVFQQETNIWCVPASIQTMLLVNMGGTSASQETIYNYGRTQMGYAISGPGHDPQAWAISLNNFGGPGAGAYIDAAYGSYDAAIRSAITSMRQTGKTAGITINQGTHAWVIGGFLTSNDPLLTSDYAIAGVYVLGPFMAWTDPPPGTFYSYAALAEKMTPYYEPERWTRWNGTYVVIQPTQ